jgi:hypothetical protein
MSIHDFPHKGREDVGRWMYWLGETFAGDLSYMAGMDFPDFHRFVANLPYKNDFSAWHDPLREVVARPSDILDFVKNSQISGVDCKKKAILIGSWCTLNGVPWELIAMSERPDKEIHHVFPLVGIGGKMVNADATYSYNRLGASKPEITHAERLNRA